MAFQPVVMSDPSGEREDFVVETAVDYSNALYRDGYVRAESKPDAVESESNDAPTAPNTAQGKPRNRRETVGASTVVADGVVAPTA